MRQLIFFIMIILYNISYINFAHSQSVSLNQQVMQVPASESSFVLIVPSNPTTGYTWQVDSYNAAKIRLLKYTYVSNADKKNIGGGGKMYFYFSIVPGVKRPFKATVQLNYLRSWEKNKAIKTSKWILDVK